MDSGGGAMTSGGGTVGGMRVFTIVWFGQLVSLVGSSLTGFGLGVWVYEGTGSVTQFAFITVFAALPGVLISPLAGALVDRWDHRRTMILSDTGAGLSTLAMVLLFAAGRLEVWHIYVATAISSILGAFQWPAYIAATTLLVPKQHLGRASGMLQMARGVAQIVAPVLAGSLLGVIGLEGIVLLDLATFLVALGTLLVIRLPRAATAVEQRGQGSSLMGEVVEGWRYIAMRPGFVGLLLFFAASNFLVGIVQVLVTPLVLTVASAALLGVILTSGGIGMFVGSVAMSVWGGPQRRMNGVVGGMLLSGLSILLSGIVTSHLLICVVVFFILLGIPVINGCTQVIFQDKVAIHMQGRVFALTGAIAGAAFPFAYAVAGPLADYVFEPLMAVSGPLAGSLGELMGVGPGSGIRLLFVLLGALTMIVTLAAYQHPRFRHLEAELPDVTPDETAAGLETAKS